MYMFAYQILQTTFNTWLFFRKSALDLDPEAQAVMEMMGKTFVSKDVRAADEQNDKEKTKEEQNKNQKNKTNIRKTNKNLEKSRKSKY